MPKNIITKQHRQAKFKGVLESISSAIKINAYHPISDILDDQNLAKELEAEWPRIFTSKFKFDTGKRDFMHDDIHAKDILLNIIINNAGHHSQTAFKIIDQTPAEVLRRRSYNGQLPLTLAIQKDATHIALKLLELMTYDEVKAVSNKITAAAQKNQNSKIIKAIEEKISYQPVVTLNSIITNSQQDIPTFPNAQELVQAAMTTGRPSDALAIGSEIMNACTEFFNRIQQKSTQSLMLGIEANANLADMAAKIERTKKDLEKIIDNPQLLAMPTGFLAPAYSFAYHILPALDPHRALKGDFNDIQNSIQLSLATSQSVMRGYEDFKQAHPAIKEQLQNLQDSLEAAIVQIDDEAIAAPEGYEDQSKPRLRKIFMAIQSNAKATGGFVDINAGIADTNLNTEVEFATSILTLQTALNATVSNANFMISNIKAAATPELARNAQALIREQVKEAQLNLFKMEALLEERQARLQTPTPFGRTSPALAFAPGERQPV